MIVFKTYIKVLLSSKFTILVYTLMLIAFGILNMQTDNTGINFTSSKPDILIINNDENTGITKSLIEYITLNANIIDIKSEEKISDALFYRDVNFIINIPQNFRNDFLEGKNPQIEIQRTNDYPSYLAYNTLSKYITTANIYLELTNDENQIIKSVEETLNINTNVEIISKLDNDGLTKAKMFFNFSNYTTLAGCIFIICLIMISFDNEKINKRTIISSVNYKKLNRKLIISNSLFALSLWLICTLLGFILIGKCMFSIHGVLYIINLLVFTITSLALSFLIGKLTNNKEAINGLVNVIALGTSFLCGAFVPMEYLPDFVLKIAHVLPSYWFILSNENISTLETISLKTLNPIIFNIGVLFLFTFVFIIISNIVSKRKRVVA